MRSVRYLSHYMPRGPRVLLRVDYNVSLNKAHRIANDERIVQTLPTIRLLLKHGKKIILASHMGRPEGKWMPQYSLKPIANDLSRLLHMRVPLVTDWEPRGKLCLLENLRFYPGEQKNDKKFAQSLASLADFYVNDAFGVSHRSDASVVGITNYLPSYAGLLLEREISTISRVMKNPRHPFVAIIGGAKIETKLGLISKLLEKADTVLLGGLLAKHADSIHPRHRNKLVLPSEWGMDIGPKTEAQWGAIIAKARTIIWNGPVGKIEDERYRHGTDFIFYSIAQNKHAVSIVGGGDTIAALKHKEYIGVITHLSTGGGAMLAFIEKGTLPGIDALRG